MECTIYKAAILVCMIENATFCIIVELLHVHKSNEAALAPQPNQEQKRINDCLSPNLKSEQSRNRCATVQTPGTGD